MEPNAAIKFSLTKLRWVDGDYDQGGAYWGHSPEHGDIYRAWGQGPEYVNEMFVRANSHEEAKAQVREQFKNATFYR